MLCFYCATAVQQKMPISGYTDKVFTETGFNNWQRALEKFCKHEQSVCHHNTVSTVEKTQRILVRCSVRRMLSKRPKTERFFSQSCTIFAISPVKVCLCVVIMSDPCDSCSGEVHSNFMQLLQ